MWNMRAFTEEENMRKCKTTVLSTPPLARFHGNLKKSLHRHTKNLNDMQSFMIQHNINNHSNKEKQTKTKKKTPKGSLLCIVWREWGEVAKLRKTLSSLFISQNNSFHRRHIKYHSHTFSEGLNKDLSSLWPAPSWETLLSVQKKCQKPLGGNEPHLYSAQKMSSQICLP